MKKGGFLDKVLGPLMKVGLQQKKNLLTPLAKSVLIQLGLPAAALETDAAIQKKIHGSGTYAWGTTALITSNKEMKI